VAGNRRLACVLRTLGKPVVDYLPTDQHHALVRTLCPSAVTRSRKGANLAGYI
jgi:hypothetical protein